MFSIHPNDGHVVAGELADVLNDLFTDVIAPKGRAAGVYLNDIDILVLDDLQTIRITVKATGETFYETKLDRKLKKSQTMGISREAREELDTYSRSGYGSFDDFLNNGRFVNSVEFE